MRSQDTGSDEAGRVDGLRQVRRGIVILMLALPLVSLLWYRCGVAGCPDPGALPAFQPGGAPVLLDRSGQEFAQLHPLERRLVALDSLPLHLPAAFLAVEDRRFYRHRGVDWIRFVRAVAGGVIPGGARHGASTLTMQLARTVFPDRISGQERTLRRKLIEIRVAQEVERSFTKDEILELYLNYVYVGAGAYGIAAAAHHYFERLPAELDVSQAALLAAVINAPANLDPRQYPERALERRNLVLTLMERQGRIDAEEAEAARASPLGVTPSPPPLLAPTMAPYLVDAVRRQLEVELGEALYRSRLVIHTTLDPVIQAAAEEELLRQLESVEAGEHGPFTGSPFDPTRPAADRGTDYLQGAVVVLDAASGDVLALVGGRDFAHSRFNRAISALRQVGSAFKPFVVAAALGDGFVASQPLADRPFQFQEPGSTTWAPVNYDGTFRGNVSMRESLVRSVNVPIVRLAMATGLEEVARTAQAAGIGGPVPATPAAALGTVSATPLELAGAYATLARLGERLEPRLVLRVEDDRGAILREPPRSQADFGMDPDVAYIVTDMLRDVVDRGTGSGVRAAGFQGPAAGKTGTTQAAHDVWFVGFTPTLVASVWIGFDQPAPILAAGATGGALAAPAWGRMMARIPAGDGSDDPWPTTPGIVVRAVDPASGTAVPAGCTSGTSTPVRELFLREFVAEGFCPEAPGLMSRLMGFLRGDEEEPFPSPPDLGPGTPERLTLEDSVERILGALRVSVAGTASP